MPVSEAQKRAKAKYDRFTKEFVFRFRLRHDADVIERLTAVPNKTEYLRRLIRADMRGESEAIR